MKALKTLLELSRAPNLPTVWSNVIAGWVLASPGAFFSGKEESLEILFFFGVLISATLLYVFGAWMNDAVDRHFDKKHRPERPLPSKRIELIVVWMGSFIALLIGLSISFFIHWKVGVCSFVLALFIFIYNLIHKKIAFGTVLIAGCRGCLYFLAAFAVGQYMSSAVILCSLGLMGYVVGLSLVARQESFKNSVEKHPLLVSLLFLPLIPVLYLFLQQGQFPLFRVFLLTIAVVFFIKWVWWDLHQIDQSIARFVSKALAGIALVDLLYVSLWGSILPFLLILGCFGLALGLQKWVAAT